MPKAIGGKRWKRNQRAGYFALILVVGHLVALGPKQAYDDGHFRHGAGWRVRARIVPSAVCGGSVAFGCFVVMLAP